MTWRPYDPCKDSLPNPFEPVDDPLSESRRRAIVEQAQLRDNCTCGASFRSAEDYRDHLPCTPAPKTVKCGVCRGYGVEDVYDGVGGKWQEICHQCHGRCTVTV